MFNSFATAVTPPSYSTRPPLSPAAKREELIDRLAQIREDPRLGAIAAEIAAEADQRVAFFAVRAILAECEAHLRGTLETDAANTRGQAVTQAPPGSKETVDEFTGADDAAGLPEAEDAKASPGAD